MSDGTSTVPPVPISFQRRMLRLCRRIAKAIGYLLLLYLFIVIVGLIPVNNDFRPVSDGITIGVTSNRIHADLILPVITDEIDWRELFPVGYFKGDTTLATHLVLGWGDKGFYLETPRWADMKASTAAKALLLPSESCLHVAMTTERIFENGTQSISISPEQYHQLVEFIHASITVDEHGRVIQIKNYAFGQNDAFFEAHGSYTAINSCNTWTGRALKTSGVRVGWLTPLPKTVGLWLPQE
ncbi:MAG: TIGR02117 family protein [Planctomycetota bacterium]|nr:TIGR02117 family protein [Planctomycetota bacterium]MDA1214805.1 TIGR02117 family protein [Planctomycetota bacterium]